MSLNRKAPVLNVKNRYLNLKAGFGAVSPKTTVGEADTIIIHYTLLIAHCFDRRSKHALYLLRRIGRRVNPVRNMVRGVEVVEREGGGDLVEEFHNYKFYFHFLGE